MPGKVEPPSKNSHILIKRRAIRSWISTKLKHERAILCLSGQNFSFTPSKLCFLIKSEEQPEVRLFAFNFVSHRKTPELTNFIFKINKKHKSGKATHKLSIPNYFISYYKRKTIKSNDSTS